MWLELLNVLGFMATSAGLFFTVVQLKKTKTAAEAARSASLSAQQHAAALGAVVSLQSLLSRSRELYRWVQLKKFDNARGAALELHESLAFFRFHPGGIFLDAPVDLHSLLHRVQEIHESLNRLAAISKRDPLAIEECFQAVMSVHVEIAGLAGAAANRAENKNANPQILPRNPR